MNIGNFDKMYKLLFDYKHDINGNVPDKLKCAKCKNVLINACQVPCGCQYCRECINVMLENGVIHCPGNKDDCKEEYLSNNQLDFRANKEISKLVVKCPEEICLHVCELIKLEEHLRICGKKSLKCPFADLGCDNNKMAIGILNEHCRSSNFNHCKILIEMIDNIRNENDSLKIKEVNNETKIEKLENELKVKSELIDSVNEEMRSVKLENENLKQQYESLKENMEKRFIEFSKEMKNQFNKQTIEMNIEKDKTKQECKEMKKNLERKIEKMVVEMQRENQAGIERLNDETKSITASIIETSVKEMGECAEECAMIEWRIDKLDERKKSNTCIESEYFTSAAKKYKMRLTFWANGRNDFQGKGCSVFLRVYSDENDDFLPWPFKGDVTIKLVNQTDPKLNKIVTKYCEIQKPPNNCCVSSLYADPPARYDYVYLDLIECGVMVDHCFVVECFVDFK